MTNRGRVARVILDSPLPQLDHELDYSIPDALDEHVQVGSRVSLTLRGGSRFVEGWVVERVRESSFSGELQPINKVISGLPVLGLSTLELARRLAARQAGSVSDVLRLAIPPRYVRVEKAWIARGTTDEQAHPQQHEAGSSHLSRTDFELGLSVGQRIAFTPNIAWHRDPSSSEMQSIPEWALNFASESMRLLELGESSILAVPDFRDMHLLLHALAKVGAQGFVLRTDSGIPGKERYFNYLQAMSEAPRIIVGNRSAVLSPAHNLGLIAMWDDGDESYQEKLAPYHHARDAALVRQSLSDARLIFAAHAVSTDVARLCELNFTRPVSNLDAPPRVVVNNQTDERGNQVRIPADALLAARNAAHNSPVLVQVASPGFAPAVICGTCHERASCIHCGGPLSITRDGAIPQCRWCQAMASAWSCRSCTGVQWRPIGYGAERTAAEIGRAFPGVPIIVADSAAGIEFVSSKPAIVIATAGAEPVAEGGYGVVLLLDGERRRYRTTLRAHEEAVRVWANAAGLARPGTSTYLCGAGEELGSVMSSWTLSSFARSELAERQQLRLPPTSRMANISGPEKQVRTALTAVEGVSSVRILGTENVGEGVFRATLTCDYRHNLEVATGLRARIISEATSGARARTRGVQDQRVVKLRVRFDESSLSS